MTKRIRPNLALAVAIALGATVTARAASLSWDGTEVGSGPDGGDGTWITGGTTNWWNGTTNVAWTSGDDATFAVLGGAVTIDAAGVTAHNLIFNATGYTLSGGALTLTGATPTITTAQDVTAIINSAITGSFTKAGTGTLTLTGSSPVAGSITISGGTLIADSASALGAGSSVTLGNASTGSNPVEFKLDTGLSGAVTPDSINNSNFGTEQIITINSGSALGPNAAAIATTLNLNGTGAVTIRGNNSGGHSTRQDMNWRITGSGISAGTTALILDGSAFAIRFSQLGDTTAASNFTGDVLIKGDVTTQCRTYLGTGNIPENQNLTFLNNDLTVSADAAWRLVWGGETVGALNGVSTSAIFLNNQSALNNVGLTVGNNNRDGVYAGSITLQGGAWQVSKVGTGTQEFSGAGLTYNSNTNLNNGTLKLTNTTGWNSNIVVSASDSPTLQFNAPLAADSWAFSKQITGGSATSKIEKVGAGTVVLNPAAGSTFVGNPAGAIVVTNGKLFLNTNFATAPTVSVGATGTFGGTATVGAISVASGGTISGGFSGANFLTADSLTFNNLGTVIGSVGTGVTPIVVSNALVVSGGANSISISLGGVPSTNGTYHLIQFGSYAGGIGNFKFAAPVRSLSLQQNGSFIDVVVNSSNFPIWTGLGSANWSTATSTNNWKLSSDSSPTDFLALDNPRFDDTASTTTVNVGQTDVAPSVMTFDNTTKAYTLTQANGKDITSGSLVKSGTGTLTISGAFSFPGGATLNAGTVSIDNEAALGTGTRTFNGGTLEYTGPTATWARNTTVNAAGGTIAITDSAAAVTHTGALSGTGVLTKAGPGTLVFSGANSGSVGVHVDGGVLQLNSATALGVGNNITLGKSGTANPILRINAEGMSLGALTVPANVTDATINFTQNVGTWSQTINGATVNSPLNINQDNATFPRWNQITWTSKITGNGGGSGNDTLIFNNTTNTQIYMTMAADVINDFVGNVHVKDGLVLVQSGSPGLNYFIPDSSMLIVDADTQWRWNHTGFVETVDGLSGGGTLGSSGNVVLTINANNAANAANRVFSGTLGGTMAGPLTLGGSGTQEFAGSNITFNNATNLNSGTLKLTNTDGWASSVTLAATGNPTLLLNAPTDSDVWSLITDIVGGSPTSKVEKIGAGTVKLTGISSYTGGTTVTAGTLLVNGSLAGSLVNVNNGGKLGGTGTVGTTLVNSGGTLAPGESIGTLNVGGALTLAGFATFEIDKTGVSLTSDLASVTGLLTLGGTLTVTETGDPLANGDTFNLFDATSFAGSFTTLNLPALGAGLSWDTSKLSVDGTLAVIPEPGSLALLSGCGMVLLGLRRRRKA